MNEFINRASAIREVLFGEIVDAKRKNDFDRLNDLSLLYVRQRAEKNSLAIITASRPENDPRQNAIASKALKHDLRSNGCQLFRLAGLWQTKEPSGSKVRRETAYGVTGVSKRLIEKLLKKYGQQVAVFQGEETNNQIVLLDTGGKIEIIGEFEPGKITAAYSKAYKGGDLFIGWEVQADSIMQALIEKKHVVFSV